MFSFHASLVTIKTLCKNAVLWYNAFVIYIGVQSYEFFYTKA